MAHPAAYDEIADWYEEQFLGERDANSGLGIGSSLRDLLGPGTGPCLELGCGTGAHAGAVRRLGWTPIGVDISAGMLRHARTRLPTARADARRLPLRDGSVPAVIAVMVHTDMPEYPAVLREAARVLRPGGVFVHIGVHPAPPRSRSLSALVMASLARPDRPAVSNRGWRFVERRLDAGTGRPP